jgi:methylated-DNA-[protein]-cysteine S-methyltransferase
MIGKKDEELIGSLLGDHERSAELDTWLETAPGRRARASYEGALAALDQALHDIPASARRSAVYYVEMQSPVGPLLLAATERGLVRIAFGGSQDALRAELARWRVARPLVRSDDALAEPARQLEEYFAGRRRVFDLEPDLRFATPFQRLVLGATSSIPAGAVSTYGDIARSIGQPGASRAVGQALGRNPVPIVIPCHRVLAGGGGMGGYTGGLEIKKRLLAIEGVLGNLSF